jgi:hypothetical protein
MEKYEVCLKERLFRLKLSFYKLQSILGSKPPNHHDLRCYRSLYPLQIH